MLARSPEKLTFLALFLTAGSLLTSWISGTEIYRWALLRNSDSVIAATVTAEKLNPCTGKGCWDSDPYQIKYQFNAAGTAYAYTGQLLFLEQWRRVPKRIWEPAARSKQISVLYAPENPRINQPADQETPGPANAFGLALIALLMAIVSGFYWRGYKV